MEFMDYVKPELFVVAVVLYFLGVAVKKSKILDCRFIPLLNGICGILICTLYVFATEAMNTQRDCNGRIYLPYPGDFSSGA